MKVWCKANDQKPVRLEVPDDAIVDDLKKEFLETCPLDLPVRSRGQVAVFADRQGLSLREDAPVPIDTTLDSPLFVVEANDKKPKISLPFHDILENPDVLHPPSKPKTPLFVCQDDWLEDVKYTVERQVAVADGDEGEDFRVEPMALVRCSRGGKTRALYEIANLGIRYGEERVTVIFVSLNDFSPLDHDDQEDPLQALLLRIAFAALRSRNAAGRKGKTLSQQFSEFREENYAITKTDILLWLGDSPALLVVDELNNLDELTVKKSPKATEFAAFVKEFFLKTQGRYFIFSTHILSSLECFGVFLDPSKASERNVVLQEPPLVNNLSTVLENLNKSLRGSREAIYYGLMPGLIYARASRPHHSVAVKRTMAMNTFVNETTNEERESWFHSILLSLLNGDVNFVPERLHILLDASPSEVGFGLIRWVPYHLQYVMMRLYLKDSDKSSLAESIANLCRQLIDVKCSSGDGREALFVLFLLARCVTSQWQDSILPQIDFSGDKNPDVLFNKPYNNCSISYDHCKTWKELHDRIKPAKKPTISVYFPTHSRFEAYDVIVTFSEFEKIKHVLGYQLKEGKAESKQPVQHGFDKSFVVIGEPPVHTIEKSGWTIPRAAEIDNFFGVSGKYWTPKKWKELDATLLLPKTT